MTKVGDVLRTIPNVLTITRMLLIPVLVVSFYLEVKASHYVSAGIFIFASITDYIDGTLARRWQAQTNFGRMLDPIADKMLVISTLIMLVDQKIAPVIPIIIIICREILVSGMREYLASIHKTLPVMFMGKIKTAIQMTAIIVLLLGEYVPLNLSALAGEACLWAAAAMTLVSGMFYFIEGIKNV